MDSLDYGSSSRGGVQDLLEKRLHLWPYTAGTTQGTSSWKAEELSGVEQKTSHSHVGLSLRRTHTVGTVGPRTVLYMGLASSDWGPCYGKEQRIILA